MGAGGRSDAAFSYVVMAKRRGYENEEAVRPVTFAQKILMSSKLTREQKSALRAVLGRRSDQSLSLEDRTALFGAVQGGDYDGACRLLGGCPEIGLAAGAPLEPLSR